MKKKLLIGLGVTVALALAVAGLFFILRMNRDPAKVYSVQMISAQSEDYGESNVYGSVTMDRMQTVYLTQTQKVTDMLVQEGQQVKQGDALLHFDTSLTQLSLDRKALEIRQLERQLEKDKKEYNTLAGQKVYALSAQIQTPNLTKLACLHGPADNAFYAGVRLVLLSETEPVPPVPQEDPAEQPTDDAEPTEPVAPAEDPTVQPLVPSEPAETQALPEETMQQSSEAPVEPGPPIPESYYFTGSRTMSGSGTADDPFVVAVVPNYELCDWDVKDYLGNGDKAYVVFCQVPDGRLDQPVDAAWGMYFLRAGLTYKFQLFDASAFIGTTFIVREDVEPETPVEQPEPGMSEDERRARMAELKTAITDNEIKLRMQQLEYQKMEKELGDGVIYARFDGTVLSVNDPDEAFVNNQPVIKLSGGGGYEIRGTISELRLEEISIGQRVEMFSWDTYETYTGTVTEISDVPATNTWWSDGNMNATYYGFTVRLEEDADLMEGSMMEMRLLSDENTRHGFYLQDAFLLQENGKSYVFVRGENALLEKREVLTGGKLWGQNTEILSGLTLDDYVAFPYAKATEAGAKTVEGTEADLYGWG